MLKSVLLAGFFWASANFVPLAPVGSPTVVAHTLPSAAFAAKAPAVLVHFPPAHALVLMASVPKSRMRWVLPLPASSPDTLAGDEQDFVERINAERTERGLNALTVDPLLVSAARAHSREMCDLDYFDHHSPTPGIKTPMDRYLRWMHDAGGRTPDYLLVGENIFYCSVFNETYDVGYGHQALMNSPGHRANILEARFTKIGLGVYHSADGRYWVTQMFARDKEPE